jgi:uncharacterized membrane protein
MLREVFKDKLIGMNQEFRFRGTEPGRLENFSDAVFALAITLLLISTSPPSSFDHIKRFVWELLPFSLCITLILLIWNEHFVFYFRYGLRNGTVILLNTVFLVIILFYVYPLKFLTRLILLPLAHLFNNQNLINEFEGVIRGEDVAELLMIYGIGASAVFFVLFLMYRYAYKKADELDLNEIERFDTRTRIKTNLLMGIVPLISTLLAWIFMGSWLAGPIAGFSYFLYMPIMSIYATRVAKKREAFLKSLNVDLPDNSG